MASPNPLWLSVASVALLGAAWVTACRPHGSAKGSPNALPDHTSRLTGQVVGFLRESGFPASQLQCMEPCPKISLGADVAGPGAAQAQQIADRVLMSTGYRAKLGTFNGESTLDLVRGPNVPPSIDRPMA